MTVESSSHENDFQLGSVSTFVLKSTNECSSVRIRIRVLLTNIAVKLIQSSISEGNNTDIPPPSTKFSYLKGKGISVIDL